MRRKVLSVGWMDMDAAWLQWGRLTDEAERPSCGGWASMRKRFNGAASRMRRKAGDWSASPAHSAGFNGAASRTRRKDRQRRLARRRTQSFNGAASRMRRKGDRRRGLDSPSPGFNGAASRMRRKAPARTATDRPGRRFNGAASRMRRKDRHPPLVRVALRASMGPPHG